MKGRLRIAAIVLVILLLFGSVIGVIAVKAEEGKTLVHFRIVWHKRIISYAAVSVVIERYEDEACTIDGGETISFKITKASNWEYGINLSYGYWVVSCVTPVNEWREVIYGASDVFHVEGEEMTVYAGIAPEGETYQLPDPWVVNGVDDRSFWIWNRGGSSSGDESEYNASKDSYELIFGDESETSASSALIPEYSNVPESTPEPQESTIKHESTSTSNPEETTSTSASVGTWLTMAILVLIVVGSAIYLIIHKRRG